MNPGLDLDGLGLLVRPHHHSGGGLEKVNYSI